MTTAVLLAVLMRWAHILAAITALGGTLFIRFVLLPAAGTALTGDEYARLRQSFMGRWKKLVHTCIALFLISGFYNYLVNSIPNHKGQPLYHALFGVKFLLALGVFYLALGLTAGGSFGSGLRKRSPYWMLWMIALAVLVVLLSGVLKTAIPMAAKGVEIGGPLF